MVNNLVLVFVISIVVLIVFSPIIGLLILVRIRKKREQKSVSERKNEYIELDALFPNKSFMAAKIISVLLIIIYFMQLLFPVITSDNFFTPTTATNYVFGSLNKDWVLQEGEWYRIFSAAFLHSNALHIFSNTLFLFICGVTLERIIGTYWFLIVFFISATVGSLVSIELNNNDIASVGVSGAIMGILGATITIAVSLKNYFWRDRLQWQSLQILVPALIPTMKHVDYAAHFGGMLGGIVSGLLILIIYRSNTQEIYLSKNVFLKSLAFLCIIVVIVSFGIVLKNFSLNSEIVKSLILSN
jgi:membrane associated rhomboid family serine protease